MEPRAFPAVAPLNGREIVVMGGRTAFNFVGDVLIFDTETEEMRLVAESRMD